MGQQKLKHFHIEQKNSQGQWEYAGESYASGSEEAFQEFKKEIESTYDVKAAECPGCPSCNNEVWLQ